MVEDNNKLIVVKHNDLIKAAQQLSLIESRIILACIAHINSKGSLSEHDCFSLHMSDIERLLPDHSNVYANVKDAVERLTNRWVYLLEPSKRTKEMKTRWVHTVSFKENEGRIDLYFSPFITPFLSELSENFTQYKLNNVMGFQSSYSIGLYELLKSSMSSESILTVDFIQSHFQLSDAYTRIDNLKRRVIDPVIADINKTSDMTVSYETIKTGRRVTAFKFVFVCREEKKKAKKPVIKKEKPVSKYEPTNNLDYYTDIRKRFGDKAPIPEDVKAEMKAKGLW
jgi:plasmid replication initiation protein